MERAASASWIWICAFGVVITILTIASRHNNATRGFRQSHHGASWILADQGAWFGAGSIPMYYINLARSPERRRQLEADFGGSGTLIRVPAVDGLQVSELEKYLSAPEGAQPAAEGEMPDWIKNLASSWSVSIGEMALSLGHWKAIKQAYDDGSEVALILEDDASPILAPYWTMTLENLAELANKERPLWRFIRLQWHNYQEVAFYRDFREWKSRPATHLVSDQPMDTIRRNYGSVAYLISRRGMEVFLEKVSTNAGTKFDCGKVNVKCASDWLLFAATGEDLKDSLVVVPPMFTVGLYETEQGTRSIGSSDARPTAVGYHEYTVVRSMRLAIENFEFYRHVNEVMKTKSTPPTEEEKEFLKEWEEGKQLKKGPAAGIFQVLNSSQMERLAALDAKHNPGFLDDYKALMWSAAEMEWPSRDEETDLVVGELAIPYEALVSLAGRPLGAWVMEGSPWGCGQGGDGIATADGKSLYRRPRHTDGSLPQAAPPKESKQPESNVHEQLVPRSR